MLTLKPSSSRTVVEYGPWMSLPFNAKVSNCVTASFQNPDGRRISVSPLSGAIVLTTALSLYGQADQFRKLSRAKLKVLERGSRPMQGSL